MTAITVHNGPRLSPFWKNRQNILLRAKVSGADDASLDELAGEDRSDRHTPEEWQRLEEAAFEVLGQIRPKAQNVPNHKGTIGEMIRERSNDHHHFMP